MVRDSDRTFKMLWQLYAIGAIAACTAMLVPNQKVQKAGFAGVLSSAPLGYGICFAFDYKIMQERRHQNQKIFDDFMKKQRENA